MVSEAKGTLSSPRIKVSVSVPLNRLTPLTVTMLEKKTISTETVDASLRKKLNLVSSLIPSPLGEKGDGSTLTLEITAGWSWPRAMEGGYRRQKVSAAKTGISLFWQHTPGDFFTIDSPSEEW